MSHPKKNNISEAIRQHIFSEHPASLKLLDLLNSPTQESRIIGGAIRNALLGLPVNDIDIATTMRPEQVIELANKAGYKTVPTGIAHGTITVVVDKHGFEVTTLRQDIETNGRHARVEFSDDFAIDAKRRDFTVNALSLGLTGEIHDYTGGLADIEQHTIRFIGNPVQRIREDYLRILRFFRFSASYSRGALDAAGLEACLAERFSLASLSRERVGHEIRKMLVATHIVQTISELAHTQILEETLGTKINYQAFYTLVKLEENTNTPPTPMRRLAAIIDVQTYNLETLRDALKLSNKEYEQLEAIQSALKTLSDNAGGYVPLPLRERVSEGRERGTNSTTPNQANFKPLIYKLGKPIFTDMLLLTNQNLEYIQSGLHLAQNWTIPKNPFSGSYFMKLGCKAGPKMGELLKQAEQAWIEHDFPNEPDQINAIAIQLIRNF